MLPKYSNPCCNTMHAAVCIHLHLLLQSLKSFTMYVFHLHGWLVALETATDGYHLGRSGFMSVPLAHTNASAALFFPPNQSKNSKNKKKKKKGHRMTCQKDVFHKQSSNLLSFSDLSEPDT